MMLKNDFSIGPYFTFDPSKNKPVYNWFYYKEAFSPEVIDYLLKGYAKNTKIIYDPFCGIGTALLRAKELGISAFGIDASPLAVFVSKTKCADYSDSDKNEIKKFLDVDAAGLAGRNERSELASVNWQFELFPPERAFPRSNLNSILSIRERIENVENENASRFLMLALLSVLPQTSLVVKDGGVLKIDKRKSAMPVKEAFRRKVKAMLADLEGKNAGSVAGGGRRDADVKVFLGDARKTDFESESADAIITSPPYLNNIDYSKIYGLELSLLALNKKITHETRARSVRSFITSTSNVFDSGGLSGLSDEVREFADRIPVVGTYFSDINSVLKDMFRILKPNGVAGFVVGNSVIHETHILVDEIIGEMAEALGFEVEIVVGLERVADVRPRKVKTRESMVVMRK